MGFFDALSRGLERSREALNEVFYFGGEVDEDFWEDLEDTLVMGDMGAEVAIKVSDDLRDAAAKKNLKTAPQLRRALAEQLEQHFVPVERDPFADTSAAGYQIVQSLYTIGSGGLSGLGLGMSRQKYLYLPEEHNDFIFSVVCEELGFIGAALILLLFALLILRGYWIALHCRDRFSFLVVAGITTLLAIQVFLNVAVVTNLVPCTGISLPFFSYGGTALLIQLGEMGIILSASRDVIEK